MGQLIKLQDYVSRYEQNIYLYPSRFVRLKKGQWEKLKAIWENDMQMGRLEEHPISDWMEEEKEPIMKRLKGFLKFRKKERESIDLQTGNPEEKDEEHLPFLRFDPEFTHYPETLDELKQLFLNQLFRFQLKWASTTLSEKSFVDNRFIFDERLKFFLQRFPDTFLFLYDPIFLLRKAPVECETVLITPVDIWIISFLEKGDFSVFLGSPQKFWIVRNQEKKEKVLSPIIGLNRTEKIVKNILKHYEIEMPIHKAVISRNGYFDYPAHPYDVQLVDKRNFDKWFQRMRDYRSPLKHIQLKAAQAMLDYGQTTSFKRMEWEIDSDQKKY